MITELNLSIAEVQTWNNIEALWEKIELIEKDFVQKDDFNKLFNRLKLTENKADFAQQLIVELESNLEQCLVKINEIECNNNVTKENIVVFRKHFEIVLNSLTSEKTKIWKEL